MGILDWLVGAPKPREVSIQAVEANSLAGRPRTIDIVGEASYQEELAIIAGPKEERGKNYWTTGDLIPETWNRKDPKAIMVRVEGHTVGYLPAEYTDGFRRALQEQGHAGCGLTGFKARVIGGWRRKEGRYWDEGHYGVKLYIPECVALHIGATSKDVKPSLS